VEVNEPPVLALPGSMSYDANIDGARHFVDNIFPLIRSRLPLVTLRIVGHASRSVRALGERPGVVVTGFVPAIETELERADAVVVPLRYGGGTRVKVLEAFAHRIPVVATSVGCAGLTAKAGIHYLAGDNPRDFAAACCEVLENADCRRRLMDNAHALFEQQYTWSTIRPRITELGRRVASG
jgi:glycosyltransferase involved in cell wall biosynthesis